MTGLGQKGNHCRHRTEVSSTPIKALKGTVSEQSGAKATTTRSLVAQKRVENVVFGRGTAVKTTHAWDTKGSGARSKTEVTAFRTSTTTAEDSLSTVRERSSTTKGNLDALT